MSSVERKLLSLLNEGANEREIHNLLKKRSEIVTMAFNNAWNYYRCFHEFWLGSDYRVDFLILSAHSANWNAIFIELKSPTSKLYNRHIKSKQLLSAERQISDYYDWVRINEQYLRSSFSKLLKKTNAPVIDPFPSQSSPGYNSAAEEIRDPRNYIEFQYHIVIGRSKTLTAREKHDRATDMTWGGHEVATYDRLITIAKRIDKYNIDPEPSFSVAG